MDADWYLYTNIILSCYNNKQSCDVVCTIRDFKIVLVAFRNFAKLDSPRRLSFYLSLIQG